MAIGKIKPRIDVRSVTYGPFQGLDPRRPDAAADVGEGQTFRQLSNVSVDSLGQLILDRGYRNVVIGGRVVHTNFYSPGHLLFAEIADNGQLRLVSDAGHMEENAFVPYAAISSMVFNRKLLLMQKGLRPLSYDGSAYSVAMSASLQTLGPSFGAAVQRRLCVAGFPSAPTLIHVLRVDSDTISAEEEDDADTSVLKAGTIDIGNLLSNADEITGLHAFEQTRLLAFTNDRCIVFNLSPSINEWALDDRANIHVGCISHNTIASAGTDVLFCGRNGVHTIQRSASNGLLVDSLTISEQVKDLYRALLASVDDPAKISAVYDPDDRQYHIFFPQTDALVSHRLTVTLPLDGLQENPATFSSGTTLNATCGAFLSGDLVFGASGGVFAIPPRGSVIEADVEGVIETPILWLQDLLGEKQVHSLTIQAAGQGSILIEAFRETDERLADIEIEIDTNKDDSPYKSVALFEQFDRDLNHRVRGMRLKFTIRGRGLIQISGFAVNVRRS